MIQFNHFNFNVLDLDKSLAFYKEALGLEPVRVKGRRRRLLPTGLPGGRPHRLPAGAHLAAGPHRAL